MRLLAIMVVVNAACMALQPDKLAHMKNIAMSKKEFDKMEKLHYGWYVQAVSALLGAMGKAMYMKMDRNNRKAFVACLDSIEKEHDLQMGAQCLVKAFDNKLISSYSHVIYLPQYDFVGKQKFFRKQILETKSTEKLKTSNFKSKIIKFLKLNIVRKPVESIRSKNLNDNKRATEKSIKSKKQVHTKLKMKNNSRNVNRKLSKIKNVPYRAKRNVLSLYTNKEAKMEAKRLDTEDSQFRPRNMASAPSLLSQHNSPVKALTNMLKSVVRVIKNQTASDHNTLQNSFKRLKELQQEVINHRKDTEFKYRMLDMVLGKDNPLRRPKSFSERFRDIMPDTVDENVYHLMDSVSKRTKDVNYNFLSPRFFPLLPDKYKMGKPMFSPDLFPFYKDDNSILPIPEVLDEVGLNEKDKNSVLELIMDASGVNEVVDNTMGYLKKVRGTGLGEDLVSITNTIDRTFQDLEKSFDIRQKREMKSRKYSFLTKKQLEMLYGPQGFYNTTLSDLPFDIDEYGSWTHQEKEESLRNTIRLLAKDENLLKQQSNDSFHHRVKRTFRMQYHKPTTLAPYAFAPTIRIMNVLGPITLSPSVFSPNIISPLLLSPPVISPQVGNPLIFSPYLLGPNVLSAAVFNVYVFSPYVLSPNVINPYVMSPLILSPFVLCPDVLSPTILSGVILSPSVLSPAVFTESALAANVLSPTFLS